jgi:hypothetical protein
MGPIPPIIPILAQEKLESAGCKELPALSWGLRDKSEPRPGAAIFSPSWGIMGKLFYSNRSDGSITQEAHTGLDEALNRPNYL